MSKIKSIVNARSRNLLISVLSGSLLFYALSGVSSLLNYGFYPIISRLVDTSTYGEIQFLTSIFTQFSVGFVVLNILSIIITGKYTVDHHRSKALQALNTSALSITFIIVFIGTVFLGSIKNQFGFESVAPILFLSASLATNVPFTIMIGRLQGQGRYVLSGLVGTLGAFYKVVAAMLFIWIGWGTSGAIAGIGVGMVLAILTGRIMDGTLRRPRLTVVKALYPKKLYGIYVQRLTHLRDERQLALAAMLALSVLTILSTADVLFAKFTLNEYEAGQFAAVATVSKTILYATTPLLWLALPLALTRLPHTMRQISKYTTLTAVIGIVLAIIFAIKPSFIIAQLLSIEAGAYTQLLRPSALAMALFALAFILLAIDLCRDRLFITVVASSSALLCFVISYFIAITMVSTMGSVIIAQIIAAFIAIIVSVIGNKMYDKK